MCLFFFAYRCLIFPGPLVEETIFAPLYCLCFFVSDQLTVFKGIYFWAFYSFFFNLFIYVTLQHCIGFAIYGGLESAMGVHGCTWV